MPGKGPSSPPPMTLNDIGNEVSDDEGSSSGSCDGGGGGGLYNGHGMDGSCPSSSSAASSVISGDISTETDSRRTGGEDASTRQGSSSIGMMTGIKDAKSSGPASKIAVLLAIGAAAVILGTATYFFVASEERSRFVVQFEGYAGQVVEAVNRGALRSVSAVEAMANSATSYVEEGSAGRSSGEEWPNVTLPDFEIRAAASGRVSGASHVALAPLVVAASGGTREWETYSVDNQGWIEDSLAAQRAMDAAGDSFAPSAAAAAAVEPIPTRIWHYSSSSGGGSGGGGEKVPVPQTGPGVDASSSSSSSSLPSAGGGTGYYAPLWQQAPASPDATPSAVNFDLFSLPEYERAYRGVYETGGPVLSADVTDLRFLLRGGANDGVDHPFSILVCPVFPYSVSEHQVSVGLEQRQLQLQQEQRQSATTRDPKDIAGLLAAVLPWSERFLNILPSEAVVDVVVESWCRGDYYYGGKLHLATKFTYEVRGPEAIYVGRKDYHDTYYDDMVVEAPFAPFLYRDDPNHDQCGYDLRIYPTADLEAKYMTNRPAVFTAVIVLVFFLTAMVFLLYDVVIQRRQDKVLAMAKRTSAIVSSLFPKNVRERILKDAEQQAEQELEISRRGVDYSGAKSQLKSFLGEEENDVEMKAFDSKPIAELFPQTTVMYADMVGFTAWSSMREPSHVFTLLETVYHAFDEIAKRRRVFKVETIGDVAVTGLPDPRRDHAVVMCRFARDCMVRMNDITKKLEVALGPDTGELAMRFGLHSGPVTAGVLRGDKSRFQLFGETVSTASRMESTGTRNRIHLSQETADLLVSAGKEHWLEKREELIEMKGKGAIQTYWLTMRIQSGSSAHSRTSESSCGLDYSESANLDCSRHQGEIDVKKKKKKNDSMFPEFSEKTRRLVDWNVEVLARLLRQVIARRHASESYRIDGDVDHVDHYLENNVVQKKEGDTVLDEVVEIIRLPDFDPRATRHQVNPDSIDLGENVMTQLHDYVTIIATMYRDNPFHNFEHASHVTMSVVKLLSRIVAPDNLTIDDTDDDDDSDPDNDQHKIATSLHDHTYGITSDPLTQFACVFSALIHDVDHTGVPNAQLVKEKAHIALVYKNQSVAEQNSVDIAWDLLMDLQYNDLRHAIYSNDEEQRRFRQLVVNSVMATDIVDKELKALRNARWEKAFQDTPLQESYKDTIDRKATIVIEHLIQASDIAHTMQHWHIYRKWNERLFAELYRAYKTGRSEKDPAEFWAKGEIGFFDFYIIPLAKKLKDCGVFGVSSDEYLNYALKNRKEWEQKGEEVVESMAEKYRAEFAQYEAYDGASLDIRDPAPPSPPTKHAPAKKSEPDKLPEPEKPSEPPEHQPEDVPKAGLVRKQFAAKFERLYL